MDIWERIRPATDAARRRWCRVGFVVGGLLPLILVLVLLAGGDGRADWERRVSMAVGLRARIEAFETPTPRHVRLMGVELWDSERGRVLRCDEIRIAQGDSRCAIVVDRVVLESGGLEALYRRFSQAVETLTPDSAQEVELVLQGVTYRVAEGEDSASSPSIRPTWERMVWIRQTRPEVTLWTGRLTLAGRGDSEPMGIQFERWRGESGKAPRSRWVVDTRNHTLPLAWLAPYLPQIESLGAEVEFRGVVEIERQDGQGVEGDCVGEFAGIDLRRWVGEPFRQVIDGQGILTLQRARFDRGRITSLTGSLMARDGYVGRPLIRALSAALSLDSVEGQLTGNRDSTLSYRSLVVRFDLTGDRLELAGDDQGVLLSSLEGLPLLAEGPMYPRRPQDLVRGLVPDSRVEVPLTRETSELMSWLPLPSTASLEPTATQAPRGALRMESSASPGDLR